jgi:hypothetical protein
VQERAPIRELLVGVRVRPRGTATRYSYGDPAPKVPSVKVCPHCAEELPDEATVCSNCHKDPALGPAWNVPERPDETSLRRLGDVFGPDGVLPTSDQVPAAPTKLLESSEASRIPSKVWMSLILALLWGFASGRIPWLTGLAPSWGTPIVQAAGYIAGLILGIRGRAEVVPSDRRAQILGNTAIALNGFRLAWAVMFALQYVLVMRG